MLTSNREEKSGWFPDEKDTKVSVWNGYINQTLKGLIIQSIPSFERKMQTYLFYKIVWPQLTPYSPSKDESDLEYIKKEVYAKMTKEEAFNFSSTLRRLKRMDYTGPRKEEFRKNQTHARFKLYYTITNSTDLFSAKKLMNLQFVVKRIIPYIYKHSRVHEDVSEDSVAQNVWARARSLPWRETLYLHKLIGMLSDVKKMENFEGVIRHNREYKEKQADKIVAMIIEHTHAVGLHLNYNKARIDLHKFEFFHSEGDETETVMEASWVSPYHVTVYDHNPYNEDVEQSKISIFEFKEVITLAAKRFQEY